MENSTMTQGKVEFFDLSYGKILIRRTSPEGGGELAFFHRKDVCQGYKRPMKDDLVEFDLHKDDKGWRARKVRLQRAAVVGAVENDNTVSKGGENVAGVMETNEYLQTSIRGVVKVYREEEGWGFFQRQNDDDVFFHASALSCSRPYQGESMVFDLIRSRSANHAYEAANIRRSEVERLRGDVVEWQVEPGSWRTNGTIEQQNPVKRWEYSSGDMVPGKGSLKPRPWHAAMFSVVKTDTGPRCVDVELDPRYPLQRFAYLGNEEQMVRSLRTMALREEWDYRRSQSEKESPILYNFLHFTFARLRDEDREKDPEDQKIRMRLDLPRPLAAFNTGLVDNKYKSIYALFDQNAPGRQQPWKFRAFCIPGEGHGKLLASYFNPLPKPARYFHSTAELLYDPDAPLHPDYDHILTHNRDRLPRQLLDQIKGMDDATSIRNLTMHLDEAIEVAQKRARWNYKTAIPHYFPSFKRVEFLLPLCLVKDNRVDVALSVQKVDTGYLASTILKLDWAYKSARLVCRPDSDWLAPGEIEESTEAFEAADIH